MKCHVCGFDEFAEDNPIACMNTCRMFDGKPVCTLCIRRAAVLVAADVFRAELNKGD